MPEDQDLSFLEVADPDLLSKEDREKYNDYWWNKTPNERLSELFRIQRAKWGDAMDKPMERVIKIIDRSKYSKTTHEES